MEGEENLLECLLRETKVECEVVLQKEKCQELGYIDFYFKDNEGKNQRVYIYRIDEFFGEPKESEEMGEPKEFDITKIPYDEMMVGDDKYIPLVIEGKRFKGEIHLSENEEKLLRCSISEIKNEKSNEIKLK